MTFLKGFCEIPGQNGGMASLIGCLTNWILIFRVKRYFFYNIFLVKLVLKIMQGKIKAMV